MTALSRACGSWGALLGRRRAASFVSIAVGLLFAAVLCAGVHRARLATSVSQQWVQQGSRLTRDRQTYERLFGGLSRDLTLVVSKSATSEKVVSADERANGERSALTVAAFRALLDASRALLLANSTIETTSSSETLSRVRAEDLCTRPAVPVILRPTSVRGFGIDRSVLSYGYAFLSICLSESSLLPSGVDPLPQSWGIKTFPCQRASALDCFRDGGFDYPPELRLIDETGLARAMADSARENSTAHKACVDKLRLEYQPLMEFAFIGDPARIESEALLLANSVDQYLVPTLATWGYSYRPRISDFKGDDAALRRHVTAGISNVRNSSITAERCVEDGVPCCRLWNGMALDPALAVGGTQFSSASNASDATAIRTAVIVDNQKSPSLASRLSSLSEDGDPEEEEEARQDVLLAFEKSFIDHFKPLYERRENSGYGPGDEFDGLQLDFFATRSADDILRDGNQAPAVLIVIGYAIMLLYTMFALANFSRPFGLHNLVFSRFGLGLSGVFVLSLGTVAGFGFVSWLDISLSPTTTNVLPFIALGIGIDDLFVIMQALITAVPEHGDSRDYGSETRDDKEDGSVVEGRASESFMAARSSVESRMRLAMARVGPSIILTSLSLFIGFLVASAVRIPAVYTFAYQLAATIIINLILLFLLFMPLCSLDSLRVENRRLDIFACFKPKDAKLEKDYAQGTIGALVGQFAKRTLGPKVLFRSVLSASLVLGLTVLFTIGMGVLAYVKSKAGLPLNTVALRGTYQRSFLDVQEASFPVFGSYLVHAARSDSPEGTMPRQDVQEAMVIHANAVENAKSTSPTPAIHQVSWFHNSSASFLGIYNSLASVANLSSPITTEDDFRDSFGTFATANGGSFLADIYCEEREALGNSTACDLEGGYPGEIVQDVELRGSRMPFIQSGLSDTGTIVDAIRSSRAAVDSAPISDIASSRVEAFVYGAAYEFYEQYVDIYRNLAKVVGLALLGVTLVVFLLLRSLRLTTAIVFIMILILVQTFGLCTAVGIQLNAVSVTSYVIAVAMSVEFTAHYAHAYADIDVESVEAEEDLGRDSEAGGHSKRQSERQLRAQGALNRMLAPSLNGFASTAVSLLALYGSRFPFVRLYYALSWMLLVLIAFLNGSIVLPCLLWLLGPKRRRASSVSGDSTS